MILVLWVLFWGMVMEFNDKIMLDCFRENEMFAGFHYRNLILGIKWSKLISLNVCQWSNG